MTNPTPHGHLPTIQRFEVVDCIDSEHVPAVIPKPHGPWVRYEDHAAEFQRLHAYCQELESQVILDCMSTQQPAPAPMSPTNRLVAYSAATRLRELGFEWDATAEAWLQPAPATQQAGWRLVPIEPTQAMLDAMQSGGWMVGNYRDMLAAAPQQEAQEPAAVVVPCHTPSGKRVALYSAKQDLPIGTKLYTGPQPSPTAEAADSVLEDAALSGEQQRAIFEAHESAASEGYFEARPQIDCNDRRRVFKAGYERGWDAARKQDDALIQQLVEALAYHRAQTRPIHQTNEAIIRGRARLEGKP